MHVKYVSDIHLERMHDVDDFSAFVEPPNTAGEVLALLGDIGDPFSSLYTRFLTWCSDHWDNTIVIYGNHECYNGRPVDEIESRIATICSETQRVHYLQKARW